jgi:multidrug efflux pump
LQELAGLATLPPRRIASNYVMISHFFIDRPIFATVLSIVITLTGGIAVLNLPIAQYPQITPPAVSVSITYPGASAQVVSDTVAAPIEQQVNGVEGMLYMSSQSGNDGSYTLTVTFDIGTDLNTALVMVQNRVMLAMPLLPSQVQNQGITIRKRTPDILMIISLYSPHHRYDDLYLSNFALIHVNDEVLRIDGVSDSHIFGERDYSIRCWLDPQKMAACGINAGDVAAAIQSQNLDLPAGQIGSPPADANQPLEIPLDALGRLSEPEQFGEIIVKVGQGTTSASATASATSALASNGSSTAAPGFANPLQTAGSLAGPATGVMANAVPGIGTTAIANLVASNSASSLNASAASGTSSGGTTGGGANSGGGGNTGGGATVTSGGANSNTAAAPETISSNVPSALASMLSETDTAVAAASSGPATIARPVRPSAGIVRLRDIGRVEMGAANYTQAQTFDGHQSVGIAVFQLPGTNALDVAERVKSKMKELKERFPEDVEYDIAYDTTPFIRESVADVVKTLLEAVALVGLVVMAFLQNWRSVLIPMIAVPVAIIGTFAAMAVVGFSLNNISLFGLVLAIGIVVDDAIVVVENVDRWLEHGLPPREAARKAMTEVTGPIIAVALVLCAVFVPCAFIAGITGRFFRQFAVTIAVSTVFSAINSLTLSPALAAILLRKDQPGSGPGAGPSRFGPLGKLPGMFAQGFNAAFGRTTAGYAWCVGKLLRVNVVILLLYAGLLVLTFSVFSRAPKGFVPQQDQGRLIVNIQLPDAASLQRTQQVLAAIDKITLGDPNDRQHFPRVPGVAHTITVAGYSFVQQATGSNFASMFIVLDPFEKRTTPELRDTAIMNNLRQAWSEKIHDAQVLVFGSPPVPGLSVAGGFKLVVEDQSGLGLPSLERQSNSLIAKLNQDPGLQGVSTQFRANTPELFMDIDRTKAAVLGTPFTDVNQTLNIFLGSLYVNSFNAFGRHWQVNVQAEGGYRKQVPDINLLEVRNTQVQMVPLGTLAEVRTIGGPIFVFRYNSRAATAVTGNIRPGVSSGDIINHVDQLSAATLTRTMKSEWTELMFMQIRDGDTTLIVFSLAVMCVFLALAALYESWSLPLAVILVVPLCLLCSVTGVLVSHGVVDVFVQIGLVVLVGLACKNAILIVEFARDLHHAGKPRYEATVEASRLRLRPILMTSFAFILGVVPLVIATGAGSEMRQSLGTAVFSGMIGVTVFGIFLTPVFFYVIQGASELSIFTAISSQWVLSPLFGGLSGAAVGYLLGQAGVVRAVWAIGIGAVLGVLVGLSAVGIHRHIKPWKKESP